MKKLFLLCSVTALTFGFASCVSYHNDDQGKGYLSLGVAPNPSFSTKTRAVNETEYKNADNYTVSVVDGYGDSLFNDSYKKIPLKLELAADRTYTVRASYGENPEVAFDKLYVEGIQQFTISDGEQKSLSLACRPANAKVSVKYTEEFLKYYSDCTVSINKASWENPFSINMNTDKDKDAYVKATDAGEELTIKFNGFKDKSNKLTVPNVGDVVKTIKPRTHLTITIDPEKIIISSGTASLDVNVDTSTEDKDVNIEIPEEYWPEVSK